jgi:hypothetical protein
MSILQQFHECLTAAENSLAANESIVQFRLGQPEMGRADYFMRFKVYVGALDASNSSVAAKRCFIVTKSSNTGVVAIDGATQCDSIPDVW